MKRYICQAQIALIDLINTHKWWISPQVEFHQNNSAHIYQVSLTEDEDSKTRFWTEFFQCYVLLYSLVVSRYHAHSSKLSAICSLLNLWQLRQTVTPFRLISTPTTPPRCLTLFLRIVSRTLVPWGTKSLSQAALHLIAKQTQMRQSYTTKHIIGWGLVHCRSQQPDS